MKLLSLLFILGATTFSYGGGTSGVGPPGPDVNAQFAFTNDPQVQTAIQKLNSSGYTIPVLNHNRNIFVGFLDCGKPTPSATFTTCGRLYSFIRAFQNPNEETEIRTVSAIVCMNDRGTGISLIR